MLQQKETQMKEAVNEMSEVKEETIEPTQAIVTGDNDNTLPPGNEAAKEDTPATDDGTAEKLKNCKVIFVSGEYGLKVSHFRECIYSGSKQLKNLLVTFLVWKSH